VTIALLVCLFITGKAIPIMGITGSYAKGNARVAASALCAFVALGLLVVAPATQAGTIYYVSEAGSDRDDGLSPESPWQSVSKVSRTRFQPGDTIKFKAGDVFEGQLIVSSSGDSDNPLTFTRYGDGARPLLDAGNGRRGAPVATILIEDKDRIILSGLEVRNFRQRSRDNADDANAYGILIKNTGRRALKGFELFDLEVRDVYPIKRRKAFNLNTVSGIRVETRPSKPGTPVVNTSDIYIHDNVIRYTGRFGIAVRHRAPANKSATNLSDHFDQNIRIVNNLCEDLGGSCVLLNGVDKGLLESNTFLRSGSLRNKALSVTRGSGAWFFRSKNIVAQYNAAIGSRGHNDSSGLHVDFGNENVLVQYNFFYDNEGYGTEILGKNKNVIWRYNVSVGDGSREPRVARPEGIKSQFPGKTVFVSDFAAPKRIVSEDIYLYNNTYVTFENTEPQVELNGRNVNLINNAFIAVPGSRIGSRVTVVWNDQKGPQLSHNLFSGAVSPAFMSLDRFAQTPDINIDANGSSLENFAMPKGLLGVTVEHPSFPAAGTGIFSHVSAIPREDIFGNPVSQDAPKVGAG